MTTGGITPTAARGPHDDGRLAAAIAASRLRGLEQDLLARVLEGSRIRRDPAGALVRPIGEGGSHLELVLAGLVRAEVSSPDGRSLTIRYARLGSPLGVASLFGAPYTMPGSLHALVDSELLELRPDVVRRVAHRSSPWRRRCSTSSATGSSGSSTRSPAARSRPSASGSPDTC